jgi:hypothetical protein
VYGTATESEKAIKIVRPKGKGTELLYIPTKKMPNPECRIDIAVW